MTTDQPRHLALRTFPGASLPEPIHIDIRLQSLQDNQGITSEISLDGNLDTLPISARFAVISLVRQILNNWEIDISTFGAQEEPSGTLLTALSRAQESYRIAQEAQSKELEKGNQRQADWYAGRMSMLRTLFGHKCLPDEDRKKRQPEDPSIIRRQISDAILKELEATLDRPATLADTRQTLGLDFLEIVAITINVSKKFNSNKLDAPFARFTDDPAFTVGQLIDETCNLL